MSFLTQVRKGIYWFEAIFLPKIAVKVWNYFHTSNSHLNFCQLARQAALPEFKIEVWNSLNFWQIHHFEGLGNIWTGFVLPNLVPDWNFATFEHTFEKSTFWDLDGGFFRGWTPWNFHDKVVGFDSLTPNIWNSRSWLYARSRTSLSGKSQISPSDFTARQE